MKSHLEEVVQGSSSLRPGCIGPSLCWQGQLLVIGSQMDANQQSTQSGHLASRPARPPSTHWLASRIGVIGSVVGGQGTSLLKCVLKRPWVQQCLVWSGWVWNQSSGEEVSQNVCSLSAFTRHDWRAKSITYQKLNKHGVALNRRSADLYHRSSIRTSMLASATGWCHLWCSGTPSKYALGE